MATDVTQIDVLEWVLQHLRSELGLSESTCFLAADDLAPMELPPAPVFVTVTPLEGHFEVEEQSVDNTIEEWTFRVRLYMRIARDRSGSDHNRLLHPTDGVLAWKQRILRALCGQHLVQWNVGRTIAAVSCTRMVWLQGQRGDLHYASLAIDFLIPIGWNLA